MKINKLHHIDLSHFYGLELGHCIVDCVYDGISHYRRLDPSEADLLGEVVCTSIYGYDDNGFANALLDLEPTTSNELIRTTCAQLMTRYPSLNRWGITDYLIDASQ